MFEKGFWFIGNLQERYQLIITMERLKNAGKLCDGPSGRSWGILNALLWECIELRDNVYRPVADAPPGILSRRLNLREPKAAASWCSHPVHLFGLVLCYHLKEMAQGGIEGSDGTNWGTALKQFLGF